MVSGHIRRILLNQSYMLVTCNDDRQQYLQAQETSVTRLAKLTKNQSHTSQISHAVYEKHSGTQSYKGKKCAVKISVQPDGMLLSAATEKVILNFIRPLSLPCPTQKIPPAPDKETWQKFRNASQPLFSEVSSQPLPASNTQE